MSEPFLPSLRFLRITAALALVVAALVGATWTSRQSTHTGFFQVRVADPLDPARAAWSGPRRAVLVVLDGLGYEDSGGMRSLAALGRRGQCRRTYVGSPSMSRPVYAVLSTGLEQDRTGARTNEDVGPLAAESLWEIARRAGMSVSGTSELSWWRELFPRGFSTYVMPAAAEDYFQVSPSADLRLIHPLYLDAAGHAAGAGSAGYRAAVERADREIEGLLATVDWARDVVVVTADHGHSLSGGHGGAQARVSYVRTCYAGAGVRPLAGAGPMESTSIGPSLAMLLGLPFPSAMRAGEDGLDVLFEIADPAAFPAGYLAGRRRAVERFRAENAAALRRWLPASEGRWSAFYAWHRRARRHVVLRWLGAGVLTAAALFWLARRGAPHGGGARGALLAVAWTLLLYAWMTALQLGLRGSFDLTSVGERAGFIAFTSAASLAGALAAGALHLRLRRSLPLLLLDASCVLLTTMVLFVFGAAAVGVRLGFPLPAPEWLFFPYFATLFLGPVAALALLFSLAAPRLAARAAAAPPSPRAETGP